MFLDNIHSGHQKYAFSQNQILVLLTYIVIEDVDMLSRRSTHVDQNLESESIRSQLSVAIFMASRTHLGPQEFIILRFYPQNRPKVALDPMNLGFCLIYEPNIKSARYGAQEERVLARIIAKIKESNSYIF